MGHGRNLTQSVNYASTHEHQPYRRESGWGSGKSALQQAPDVRALPEDKQYHKKFWDHDATRLHMHTTGWHSTHLDALMGVSFDDMEGLSVRQQRDVIKRRAYEMHRLKQMKFKYTKASATKIFLNARINPYDEYAGKDMA